MIKREVVEDLAREIEGQAALLKKYNDKEKQQTPPLPYSLSSLQIDAAKCFNFSAKQSLDICQSLYEKHRLITYPRSDCRYLPSAHHSDARNTVQAIGLNEPKLRDLVSSCNLKARSRAWNDKQVGAHHAIVPTGKQSHGALSVGEAKIYELIARQYLMQFLGPFVYRHVEVILEICQETFKAQAKMTRDLGWKRALFASEKKWSEETNQDNESDTQKPLLGLTQQDSLRCVEGLIIDKMTTPPKHFDNATLVAAMSGIARFVEEPSLKLILKETDGLGTEATRAQIIELLFKRGFLKYQGKLIIATDVGRALIAALPAALSSPDMTAAWEHQLEAICDKRLSYQRFMLPLQERVAALIEEIRLLPFQELRGKRAQLGKSFSPKSYGGKSAKKSWSRKKTSRSASSSPAKTKSGKTSRTSRKTEKLG